MSAEPNIYRRLSPVDASVAPQQAIRLQVLAVLPRVSGTRIPPVAAPLAEGRFETPLVEAPHQSALQLANCDHAAGVRSTAHPERAASQPDEPIASTRQLANAFESRTRFDRPHALRFSDRNAGKYADHDAAAAVLGADLTPLSPGRSDANSVAMQIVRLHTALSPYAGGIATAVLILAASLVYCVTVGRSGASLQRDLQQSSSAASTWRHETTPSESIAVSEGSQGDYFSEEQAIEAPDDETANDAAAPLGPPVAAAIEGPMMAPPANAGSVAKLANKPERADSVLPTPASGKYPVTPYAEFRFDKALTPSAPIEQPAIGEDSTR